jgi:hypothetical protein
MAGRSSDISFFFHGASVTTSDSTILPTFRSLYIGVTGNVAIRMPSGASVTFSAVPVGIFNVQGDQVLATGTTATNIVALY